MPGATMRSNPWGSSRWKPILLSESQFLEHLGDAFAGAAIPHVVEFGAKRKAVLVEGVAVAAGHVVLIEDDHFVARVSQQRAQRQSPDAHADDGVLVVIAGGEVGPLVETVVMCPSSLARSVDNSPAKATDS
jgi:hypothetical protein